jgi:SAM-dependent methyltransferase
MDASSSRAADEEAKEEPKKRRWRRVRESIFRPKRAASFSTLSDVVLMLPYLERRAPLLRYSVRQREFLALVVAYTVVPWFFLVMSRRIVGAAFLWCVTLIYGAGGLASIAHRLIRTQAAGRAHNGLRILELGSGSGRDAVELARSRVGIDFVGVDGSAGMCGLAAARAEKRKVGFKCEFREQEFFEASFFGEGEGGTFDGAFAVDSLKHVPWDLLEAALSKVRRSLTPGGSFVVAEARVARKKPKAADGDDGPDRFTLSRDGEYAEQRTWLEWREKLQKFFVLDKMADYRAAKESEIPNFKGFDLGHYSLVSADFWTSDHLLERPRSVDAFPGTRARNTHVEATLNHPFAAQADYDVADARRRKKTFWAASWIAKASAPDVPPPPNFVDTTRRDVDPADLDEPVVEDLSRIDDGPAPPPKKPLTHLERLRADLVCTSCDTDEPVRRKPWPDDDPEKIRAAAKIRAAELAKRARTHGEPSLEECAEYVRAKNLIEEAERAKFPDAPRAPESRATVPFGHLRVNRDAPPPAPAGDAMELLEDGDFDISGDAEALASQAKAARKKARALGAGFGRGFLN